MKRKKVDILFLFEKSTRELDSLCLLKKKLNDLNFSCEIIQQNTQQAYAIKNFKPSVVVLPFCYQNRSNNIFFKFWRNSHYISLNWEQFFYQGNKAAKTPKGHFASKIVKHCAWSDKYSKLLIENGVPRENIWKTGSFSFELCDNKYRGYFLDKAKIATKWKLDPNKKWVFFPENFGWAFYSKEMLQQMVDDGQSVEQVNFMNNFCKEYFASTIKWLIRLAEEEEIELIFRPRPATSVQDIEEAITNSVTKLSSSFRIIKEETVKDWIYASDIVLSSYSTTLIEAALIGKPTAMLIIGELPKIFEQEWHSRCKKVVNYEDLKNYVKNGSNDSKVLSAWIKNNYLNKKCTFETFTLILKNLLDNNKVKRIPIKYLYNPMNKSRFIHWINIRILKLRMYLKFILFRKKKKFIKKEYLEDYNSVSYINDKVLKFKSLD